MIRGRPDSFIIDGVQNAYLTASWLLLFGALIIAFLIIIQFFVLRWFCHFDDDNYVNIPRLVKLLEDYPPSHDWYIGKPSIRSPLELLSRDNQQVAQQVTI
jgi:fringe glycosyltransferase